MQKVRFIPWLALAGLLVMAVFDSRNGEAPPGSFAIAQTRSEKMSAASAAKAKAAAVEAKGGTKGEPACPNGAQPKACK